MRTLKITVDDTPQVELLAEMLRGLAFVKKIEDTSVSSSASLLDTIRKEAISHRERIRNHLLEAPTLDEDELTIYQENRDYLNQWRAT